MPETPSRDNEIMGLSHSSPYLISLSSFNNLLRSIERQEIQLDPGELSLYVSGQFATAKELFPAVQTRPEIVMDGERYLLSPEVHALNLIADRFITIKYALIVPDEIYRAIIDDPEPFAWNMILNPAFIKEQGLMQALYQVSPLLANTDLEYESYLTGIGRQLFYLVAGSYITLYLGVLFLIIANTVLGLKFLMQQRSTRHRYETLFILGADEESLCSSARTQIRLYFGLIIGIALISSVFGVWSMLNSVLRVQSADNVGTVLVVAGIAVFLFLLIEFSYIRAIQAASDKEIHWLNSIKGE
jgi:putative ABC transport system permease protein